MADLSLIPLDDIIKEIEKRKEGYVLAYIEYEGGIKKVMTSWSENNFIVTAGLASILVHDVNSDPNNFKQNRDGDLE